MNAAAPSAPPLLSVVVPVFRGAHLLDDTLRRLTSLEEQLGGGARLEIIAVDDGSDDDTYAKILQNKARYPGKIRAVKLSRNFGEFGAVLAGLDIARGDCIAKFPDDLQEPPELLLQMFAAWRAGTKINIGVRKKRVEPAGKKIPAVVYHRLFRALVVPGYPPGGMCAFAIDRQVVPALRGHLRWGQDPSPVLFTLGFSRKLHPYVRVDTGAKSKWSLAKLTGLAVENFIGLSSLPVRLISLAGVLVSLSSFGFAAYVFIAKITGYIPNMPPGWATIIVLLTGLFGMTMLMLGIIGEYLWRTLEAARQMPPYIIDEMED